MSSAHTVCRVSSSHMMTPKEYTSISGPYARAPRSTSGAIHSGVPTPRVIVIVSESSASLPPPEPCRRGIATVIRRTDGNSRDVPKSATLTCSDTCRRSTPMVCAMSPTNTLSDLRSRWIMGTAIECRCRNPLPISAAKRTRVGQLSSRSLASTSRSEPWAISSVTRNGWLSDVTPAPKNVRRCGCLIDCSESHSRRKSSAASLPSSETWTLRLSNLTATSTGPHLPAHTSPKAPDASRRSHDKSASGISHARCSLARSSCTVPSSSSVSSSPLCSCFLDCHCSRPKYQPAVAMITTITDASTIATRSPVSSWNDDSRLHRVSVVAVQGTESYPGPQTPQMEHTLSVVVVDSAYAYASRYKPRWAGSAKAVPQSVTGKNVPMAAS
mmetsp:Transcript_24086/g.71864  ORF Transcript_24086/g.71864 Transcript_24086/m.71864 type:complete len:385 (-) Transcript_24086:585-1739(-)